MKPRLAFLGSIVFALALAACGSGGSSGPGPLPSTSPTMTPTPVSSATIVLSAAPTTAPIPGAVSGTASIPAGSGTLTITASANRPSPVPTALIARRASATVGAIASGNTVVQYFTATATGGPVTLDGLPGFTITLPAGAPTGAYFVAYYGVPGEMNPGPQSAAWVSTTTGSTVAGGMVSVPATTSPQVTLQSGASLYLAVYTGNYIPPINIFGCVGVNIAKKSGGSVADLTGSHPITSGDAYNYSGALSEVMSRSQPCPQPTATSNATVTIAVTMGSGTETSAEADAFATNTTALNTVANVALTSGRYLESSETATDGNNNSVVTSYGATPLQYGQLPEGSGGWTNSPPATVTSSLADGTSIVRTYAGAGTYQETETLVGGLGLNKIVVNADGSGSYGTNLNGTGATTFGFAAPSGGNIVISSGGSPVLTVPSWIPSPLHLYSDATQDLGTVGALPAYCTFVSPGGGTPDHLQRTIRIVDPILGYIENETMDSYDLVGYTGGVTLGPVCTQISDVLTQYYDFSLLTPYGLFASGNAQSLLTDTIQEQISLTTTGLVALARGRGAVQGFAAVMLARQSGIRFTRALWRAGQVQAMSRSFANFKGLK